MARTHRGSQDALEHAAFEWATGGPAHDSTSSSEACSTASPANPAQESIWWRPGSRASSRPFAGEGQTIIIENVRPPEAIRGHATIHEFAGLDGPGRKGFYP